MFRSVQPDLKTVTVYINDTPCKAEEGEMMAAVLMRENLTATHASPQGQPRGPYCMMGVCYDCMISLEDGGNVQACLTRAEDGLKIYLSAPQHRGAEDEI